ncbi:MAG: cupin domain-containing protein [Gammaproteobacteria bacterium]|nr:cupin domain-containing protein [Gammaproteobacteria bacterium]
MKIVSLAEIPETAVSHNPAIRKQLMLGTGELSNLIQFSQARFPPGELAPTHTHNDMAEVFFVSSGRGRITVDGREFEIYPGACILVEANEHHEILNDGDTDLVLLYFGLRD